MQRSGAVVRRRFMTSVDTGSLPVLRPGLVRARDAWSEPVTAPDDGEVWVAEAVTPALDFAEFVVARGPTLVRLARGLLRDPHQAEDVVQDVLAKALLHWPRISRVDAPEAYVRRMVINGCTSWFRRAARRERPQENDALPELVDGDPTGSVDDRDRVVALLRTLSYRQRAVLVLRHYEGLVDREIAGLLEITEPTVRSLAFRGLARLRLTIEQEDAASAAGQR
jgi:RNA polymerase sigma-70 factor (sigma-E family)